MISRKTILSMVKLNFISPLFLLLTINLHYAQPKLNIVTNGEFDNQKNSWQLKIESDVSANFSICSDALLSGKNSMQIDITKGGADKSSIRLVQSLLMQEGRDYSIYFIAKAKRICKAQVALMLNSSDKNPIWTAQQLTITQQPQRYGPFEYRNLDADNYKTLSFLLGGQDSSTVWIDSVVVNVTDNPGHFRKEELLQLTFRDTLKQIMSMTDNKFLKLTCQSLIDITGSQYNLLYYSYSSMKNLLDSFCDTSKIWNVRQLNSYLERKRTFLISWISKEDGKASFAYLLPPEDFDPEKTYPLYLSLHGYMTQSVNPIDYLAYRYAQTKISNEPYEDGYWLQPWGRGNLFYQGIGETDVWEAIEELKSIVKIDKSRMYLTGHSMGGFGAWYIGQKSTQVWAALGIHAAVYSWNTDNLLTMDAAQKLKNIPVYIVCGTLDGLYQSNLTAYNYLQTVGNTNIHFASFNGGHDYLFPNLDNMHHWLKNWVNTNPTDAKSATDFPAHYKLDTCFPNPFNPSTTISYSLPCDAKVILEIYNSLGQKIATLRNEVEKAGNYKTIWHAKDFSSGIYFCRFIALGKQSFHKSQKLVLIK